MGRGTRIARAAGAAGLRAAQVGYRPEQVLSAAAIVDPGPIEFTVLPRWLQEDEDFARVVDARYEVHPSQCVYRLLRVDREVLFDAMLPDDREWFARVRRHGPGAYRQLERAWRRSYARELDDAGPDADPFEIDDEYPDGDRRAAIVEQYLAQLRGGEALAASVVDLHSMSEMLGARDDYSGVHIMDGYHRLAAHLLAGSDTVDLYELLPED